jgi:hypothetical protein
LFPKSKACSLTQVKESIGAKFLSIFEEHLISVNIISSVEKRRDLTPTSRHKVPSSLEE